jgi:hypothetical protein
LHYIRDKIKIIQDAAEEHKKVATAMHSHFELIHKAFFSKKSQITTEETSQPSMIGIVSYVIQANENDDNSSIAASASQVQSSSG